MTRVEDRKQSGESLADFQRAAHAPSHERWNALENIVTNERGSFLLVVSGEDSVYVVGYMADVRGLLVSSERFRVPKSEIVLRISVPKELKPNLDSLTYGGRATG